MNNDKYENILSNYLEGFSKIILSGPMQIQWSDLNSYIKSTPHAPLICVDGGTHNIDRPYLSVGDGDSSLIECDIKFPTAKNYTDLEGLLGLLPKQISDIQAFGFQGGRLDHQLVVIKNFFDFAEDSSTMVTLHGPQKIQIYPPGKHEIDTHDRFSLISMNSSNISIEGNCKYQSKQTAFSALSGLGISNKGEGQFTVDSTHSFGLFYFHQESDHHEH